LDVQIEHKELDIKTVSHCQKFRQWLKQLSALKDYYLIIHSWKLKLSHWVEKFSLKMLYYLE